MEYQKIQTVFKRDAHNVIIPTELTRPEFEWLKNCKFRAEEKIDGTNIRVEIGIVDGELSFEFAGRTDKAIIPTHLKDKLSDIFTHDKLLEVFGREDNHITLYGEGYGYKIQSSGSRYIRNQADFILFDVKIGNWWLQRDAIEDIAKKLDIKVVPIIGYMTIMEAIKYVDDGFKSTIAEDKTLDAEGLVLKTPDNLLMRSGERIVLKIKTTDFRKFRNTYGDDALKYTQVGDILVLATSVSQPVNDLYKEK